MLALLGYQIDQELYASHHSLVYRARRVADSHPVILKVANQEYPSPERVAWFRREFELMRSLALPNVVKAHSLTYEQQHWIMVLEDGGDSLNRLRLAGTLPLDELLRLAIRITEAVGELHQQYVIHKDLNPTNIVYNPSTGEVKLIDFGISTALSRETASFRNPNVLEGTLAYISPEQTGRMNRDIDYRTDFYSLGVTLYELLTGRLPFVSADALELVHSHIAKLPPPPHHIVPSIPPILSAIVLKLLAKNAEDRYQSAYGIVADLRHCLAQWEETGEVQPFALAQSDRSDRFQIPQKLYGREADIDRLLAAFERVSAGAGEMLLIAGYSGIGKSALVHEIYKPITARRGYYIAGKFDQLQRTMPYSAVLQALRSLMQQLLTESEASVVAWRETLLTVLGNNVQLLFEAIPELVLIVGELPAPTVLPNDVQHLYRHLLLQLIRLVAQPSHPLVLVLDDLQWADSASLTLIEALMTHNGPSYLLLIGTYRDNEVNDSHPLALSMAALREANVAVELLHLAPLSLADTCALLVDTLHQPLERVEPLAVLVQRKTLGNPFFMGEFLRSLYVSELLQYRYPTAEHHGGWEWEIERIQEHAITDNVIELLDRKVQTLPEITQNHLRIAACLGNQFELMVLAQACDRVLGALLEELWPAVAEGLLVPIGDAYKFTGKLGQWQPSELIGSHSYRFVHDRVQQAIYLSIPESQRAATHYQLGAMMLRNTPTEKHEERIFTLVEQLNHGIPLLSDASSREQLAHLNAIAARKATSAAAYQPAYAYVQNGLALLDADAWRTRYSLALDLHIQAAEIAYLCGDEAAMTRYADEVLARAQRLTDRLKLYEILIRANRAMESSEIAFDVLRQLGVTFPAQPTAADLEQALAQVQELLAGRSISDLRDLPRMTDSQTLAIFHLMSSASIAVYAAKPQFFPLYVLKQVEWSIRYGNAPQSPYAYALYGMLLCGWLDNITEGYQWGQLGLHLLDTLEANEVRARTLFMAQAFINHWSEPVRETLSLARLAYQSGFETGDLDSLNFATVSYTAYALFSGRELPVLEQEIVVFTEAVTPMQQEATLYRLKIYRQTVLNLMGKTSLPHMLSGEVYDLQRSVPLHLARHDGTSAYAAYLAQALLFYLFEQPAQALSYIELAEGVVDLVVGQFVVTQFYFYDSLIRLALYADMPEQEHEALWAKVNANQQRLANWAAYAPENVQHHWLLVEAELARVRGRYGDARELYDQSIALAQQHGYLHDEALAQEMAGRMYVARGQLQFAQVCLQNAHYAYQRWGAQAKVQHIEERYPHYFSTPQLAVGTTSQLNTARHSVSGALDMASVSKALQAISGEIVLSRLLHTLVSVLIENAGAQQGYLLLMNGNGLVPVAQIDALAAEQVVLLSPGHELTPTALPNSIITYVARTHETVLLHDAAGTSAFALDAYLQHHRPRSLLCVPLLNQGRLVGVLYLENNLVSGVFTAERLEVLQLLAAQTAISIENANLYSDLERSEHKYRTLFEHSHDAILVCGPDGTIIDANPACTALLGYSPSELQGKRAVHLVAEPAAREQMLHVLTSQASVRDAELILRSASGTLIDCLVTASTRYDDDGSILGYQGIIRDLSERRRLEHERARLLAIQRELDFARNIQQSLLPPSKVVWPELEAMCYNMPAREVGGDFYIYRKRKLADEQRFTFALGDVTGKGIPAALLMAISMVSLQAIALQDSNPNELLKRLDRLIARYTRSSRQNCALLYAEIVMPQRRGDGTTLLVANAGCVTPLLRRASGEVEWIDVGGLPLGTGLTMPHGYAISANTLRADDMVILTSDGVIEAKNPDGEMFGFERMADAVASGPTHSAEAMLAHLQAALADFVGGGEPHDDVTIIVVRMGKRAG